jgi:hypothetical protein
MTGKAYYITTLADWRHHAPRFVHSHYVVLDVAPGESVAKILALVEADEGAHLALESDPAFEALPHPLAQRPISAAAQSALAPHGVPAGATTFDAAETLARVHPLLKHRVF